MDMEIRDLAERVLFGATLDDKLVRAGRLTDAAPGAPQATPDAPGRPPELALDRWSEGERVAFADVRDLESDEERGLVLHFFANHELLAAELMALVLLKFPEAPARFRRGVAQTLKDEQEHVRLYLARMRAAGVEFGQIPVSDFFWRAIAPMPSPLDFVTRLSLTLEQANLDYAPHYGGLFAQLGDVDTAALLRRIYRDEIGHVRLGLNWFNTWREPTRSAWECYERQLGLPLSPSRAKGTGRFNREGRLQAGLPAAFVDQVEVFTRSHGRCPNLYWFNPTCDLSAGRGAGFTPSGPVRDLARDLALVPALLAAPDDIVVVPERPDVGFLRSLKAAALPVPELVEWDPGAGPPPDGLDRRLTELRPWGWSPDAAAALAPLAGRTTGRLQDGTSPPAIAWAPEHRRLYAKSWSAEWLAASLDGLRAAEGDAWLCDGAVVGRPCADEAAACREVARVLADAPRAVIKADYGTAGAQQVVVDALPLAPHRQAWLRRAVQDAGAVVVEPWLDRVLDLSAQYDVDSGGAVRLLGVTRFLTDAGGRFQGVFVHNLVADLDASVRRFLYGDGQDGRRLQRLFTRLGQDLGRRLPRTFRGPLGVDALVYRDAAGALRLKPVVEVNPRHTMGRVGLGLARRVLSARTAVWRLVRVQELRAAGYDSPSAWAAAGRDRCPVERTADGTQLAYGMVCTNDPATARSVVGVLWVAASPEALRAAAAPLSVLP